MKFSKSLSKFSQERLIELKWVW